MFYYAHRVLASTSFSDAGADWSIQFDGRDWDQEPTAGGSIETQTLTGYARCFAIGINCKCQCQVPILTNAGLTTSRIQIVVNGQVSTCDGVTDPDIDLYEGDNQIFVVVQPDQPLVLRWNLFGANPYVKPQSLYLLGTDPYISGTSTPTATGQRNRI